jgi:hypothetical protein
VSSSSAAARSRCRPDAPPPHSPCQAPHQHHITPSPQGSFLATSPRPSSTPAIGMPLPPLGAPSSAPVRRRYAASAPPFLNAGHPRDRRELLNLFPHLPLAAGEPPRLNLITTHRHPCVTCPRTQLQGFKSFQGHFCGKIRTPPHFKSAKFENP